MKQNLFLKTIINSICLTFLFGSSSVVSIAQEPDTLKRITFDKVVITANRYENRIYSSGTSIGLIGSKELKTLPVTDLSNTLQYLPGVYMASGDGMGLNPQVTLRGFYGGGEAEYVNVLIDGIPVNDLENGLANWNLIPLTQVSRMELLRGGSSALYGDAAMGGVLNIITEKMDKPFTTARIGYGSFNTSTIGVDHGGKLGKGRYEIFAGNDHTEGFRDHSQWNSTTFGGKIKMPVGNKSSLTLSSFNQLLNSEDPGPLDQTQADKDRTQSAIYYREDGKDANTFTGRVDFSSKINKNTDLDVNLSYQHKDNNQTRTYTQTPLILDPNTFSPMGVYDTTQYGNTKLREIVTDQANLGIRLLNVSEDPELKILGGIDATFGNFDNRYYDVFYGFENDYLNNFSEMDSLDTKGKGTRFKAGAYLNGEITVADPLKLIAGLRYDVIVDDFSSSVPDTTLDKTYSALSPKIALTVNTGESDNYSGSIFLSYSQSFKAPTVDQRTDLKRLNYAMFFYTGSEFYPMIMIKGNPFSNGDLKPQISNNFEIGTYQFYKFSKQFSGEMDLTGYMIKIRDEIDFDLSTLQYNNIVDTKHTGLEASMKVNYRNLWSGFFNLNYTEVKFNSGENEGNFLKGIPKTSFATGVSYSAARGIGGTLIYRFAGGMYLDDENTSKMDSYGVMSARLDYKFNFVTVYIDCENVLDNSYSTTGYLVDGKKYLFPAVGRFIRGGLNFSF